MSGAWDNENGNINIDTLFVNKGNGNYKLRPSSPSIDTGFNTVPQIPSFDIEGNNLTIDGDRDGTETVDMGPMNIFPVR